MIFAELLKGVLSLIDLAKYCRIERLPVCCSYGCTLNMLTSAQIIAYANLASTVWILLPATRYSWPVFFYGMVP